MKKKIIAITLAVTILTGTQTFADTELIGPKTESTKFFTESFDYYENDVPKWYLEGNASIFKEENGNKVMRIDSSEGKAYVARTFRETTGDFVVDFTFMPEQKTDAQFILFSEGYRKFIFAEINSDGSIVFDGQNIGEYKVGEINRITAIVFVSTNSISLTINENSMNLKYIPKYKQIAGIGCLLTAGGGLCIDNIRCYASTTLLDDYDLMTDAEKVYDLLDEKVAVVIDSEKAMSGRTLEMINPSSESVRTQLVDGNTMVPLRFISEKLGATVTWQKPDILVEKEGEPPIRFSVGSTTIYVGGTQRNLNAAPFIKDGTTFVPLRAFAETMGYNVYWHKTGVAIVGYGELEFREPEKSEEIIVDILETFTGDTYYYDTFGEPIRLTDNLDGIGRRIITPVGVTADTSDDNIPSNLIDGSLDTRWSGAGTEGVSAYVDYGYVQEIAKIAIAWNNGASRNEYYEIYSSVDGVNWTLECKKRQSSGRTTNYEILDLNCQARYIRYNGFGNSASFWNSVSELTAFGELR